MSSVASDARPDTSQLALHGLDPQADIHWNLSRAVLVEHTLAAGTGELTESGSLAVITAPHTGRSPQDRYVVREPSSAARVWWGDVNIPLDEDQYAALKDLTCRRLEQADIYVQDVTCGADPAHSVRVRVMTESPWHALFAANMFRPVEAGTDGESAAAWSVYHAPSALADPARHGTRTGTYIVLNLGAREVVIGGTLYAGEIKKSMFAVMNYLLPGRDVLPMHCSANVGRAGDVALFFGLSGTGKTSLSTDETRPLIGDDEHGWSADGVFNFEGGSYAKVIRISATDEPSIFSATNRFGTIVENVVVEPVSRVSDYNDATITENTRSSYPLAYLGHIVPEGRSGHARSVVFLAADAFGVMPPIARLTEDQAMYYFLSGYTAKVAGTERGVVEPQATFSPCFGAPFLPLPPGVYAELLGRRIREHQARVWLVNTGWTGGPYGVGQRVPIRHTRAMLHAALSGMLDAGAFVPDPVFGFDVPGAVPGVPEAILNPRGTWPDTSAYDAQARALAAMFTANLDRFAASVPESVRQAGPRGT